MLFSLPPESSLETDQKIFATKGQNLDEMLAPELKRILTYPEKGWIAHESIPNDLRKAYFPEIIPASV